MRKTGAAGLAALLSGLLLSLGGCGFLGGKDTPARAAPARAPGACAVKVARSQPDGTYDVTRQVIEGGGCICFVYTGAHPQPDRIERAITALQETGECSDARQMAVSPPPADD